MSNLLDLRGNIWQRYWCKVKRNRRKS